MKGLIEFEHVRLKEERDAYKYNQIIQGLDAWLMKSNKMKSN